MVPSIWSYELHPNNRWEEEQRRMKNRKKQKTEGNLDMSAEVVLLLHVVDQRDGAVRNAWIVANVNA